MNKPRVVLLIYPSLFSANVVNKLAQNEAYDLATAGIIPGHVDIAAGDFSQAALPLYGAGQYLGTVAGLISHELVINNTWQIVQVLLIVSLDQNHFSSGVQR